MHIFPIYMYTYSCTCTCMYSTLYGHIPADLNNPETPLSSVKGGTEEVSARDRQSSSVQKQLENVENNLPFSDTDTDRKSFK